MQHRRHRPRGFTVIELMIALVLMALIITGLTSMVMSATHAQAYSAKISVAQGGIRAVLEMMTRDIMSTSAGASKGTVVNGSTLALPPTPLVVNVVDSSVGPDRLDLILANATNSMQTATPFTGVSTLITLGPSGIPNPFGVGRVQLCDLATATLLDVTGTGIDGNGNPTLTVTPPTNPLPVPSYPAGSWVISSRIVSYYVTNLVITVSPPVNYSVLMMDPDGPGPLPAEPLAEGIEDFQVALGIDLNGNGIIDPENATAAGLDEWIFNVAGETMPATLTGLKAIRVTLVAQTTSSDVALRGQRPAAENHPAAAAPDDFPRRVVRSEIAVRNFNL